MFKYSRWPIFSVACALSVWVGPAAAAPCSAVSSSNLARCVLGASLEQRAGQAAEQAANGRVQANDPWFPSTPTLALTGARRSVAGQSVPNWSASLAVELEVAGQRGARRDAGLAEREAQRHFTAALGRATTAQAFQLYFEVLAARETQRVLARLGALSTRVWEAAHAAAERGAGAGIEADVADVARVSVLRRQIDAARDEQLALGSLTYLVGLSLSQRLEVAGSLEPLARAAQARRQSTVPDAPEVRALSAEGRASSARAKALRRGRIPNPTVSVFVERDGLAEHLVGVGVAFPLPLPEPVGRTSAGEIAESEALARRASFLAEHARRNSSRDLARAIAVFSAAEAAVGATSDERVARAQLTSANLAEEAQAGRVSIRDAVALQGPLLELLLGAIETRKALCLASVALVLAAGLPLDGAAP